MQNFNIREESLILISILQNRGKGIDSTFIQIWQIGPHVCSYAILRNREKSEDLHYLNVLSNIYKYFQFMMCFELFFRFCFAYLCSFCPGCHYLVIVGITCAILYLKFLISGSLSALKIHNFHILHCILFISQGTFSFSEQK